MKGLCPTFAVAFLMACIGSQWRGDTAAILMVAVLTGTVGIVAAVIRNMQENRRAIFVALGVLNVFLLLASVLLLIIDWPFRGRATGRG